MFFSLYLYLTDHFEADEVYTKYPNLYIMYRGIHLIVFITDHVLFDNM